MHQIYRPVFRRTYLIDFMGLDREEVERIMREEDQLRGAGNQTQETTAAQAPVQTEAAANTAAGLT
jgi:hypothetical protein